MYYSRHNRSVESELLLELLLDILYRTFLIDFRLVVIII